MLARLEGLHRERERTGTVRLEASEVRQPGVELSGREQHLAQILVRRRVARIRVQNRRVRRDCRVRGALLLEQHAQVEVGGSEVGSECQRPLIRPRGVGPSALHLQRDAVVVMGLGIVRIVEERLLECGSGSVAVTLQELREAERPPECRVGGRLRQTFPAQRNGLAGLMCIRRSAGGGYARVDISRRRHERSREIRTRGRAVASVALDDSAQVVRRRDIPAGA